MTELFQAAGPSNPQASDPQPVGSLNLVGSSGSLLSASRYPPRPRAPPSLFADSAHSAPPKPNSKPKPAATSSTNQKVILKQPQPPRLPSTSGQPTLTQIWQGGRVTTRSSSINSSTPTNSPSLTSYTLNPSPFPLPPPFPPQTSPSPPK